MVYNRVLVTKCFHRFDKTRVRHYDEKIHGLLLQIASTLFIGVLRKQLVYRLLLYTSGITGTTVTESLFGAIKKECLTNSPSASEDGTTGSAVD